MRLFIVAFLFLANPCGFAQDRPLFSNEELKEIEVYKSDEYLREQRIKELQTRSHAQIRLILKSMSKFEKEYLEKKFKKGFWKKFDLQTDDALRKRIILDLILKDLYKDQEK
jgi:hypothetical protein